MPSRWDILADAFDWWLRELRAMFSKLIPSRVAAEGDWLVSVATDGLRVDRRGAAPFQSPPLPLDAAVDEIVGRLDSAEGSQGHIVDIEVRQGRFLRRELSMRRLPRRQARAMAELDLLASTPIDPTGVLFVFNDEPHGGCGYSVVKRKTLAGVLEAIGMTGKSLGSLSLADEDVKRTVDRASIAAILPGRRGVTRLWGFAGALAVLALAGTYLHAEWRYWQAGKELDRQIEAVQASARNARATLHQQQESLARMEAIRAEKKGTVSLVRVIGELTHILPDSAWLTDLVAQGDELTITGFAASAADLIGPLERSPLIASPEFITPVVKVPGQTGERFTISARLETSG